MGYVDTNTAKKALESYIKGLIQDFMNEYGVPVAQIELNSTIDEETHRRKITDVKVLSDVELPATSLI